jgi:hypothetical protein
MRNNKLGIVMYIITFILIIFAFWFVGCSSDSTSSGPQLCVENEANKTVSGTVFTEQSKECDYDGEWL